MLEDGSIRFKRQISTHRVPIPNALARPIFSFLENFVRRMMKIGRINKARFVAAFTLAVATYTAPLLIHWPSLTVIFQFFSIGVHANTSAKIAARLYDTRMPNVIHTAVLNH